MRVLGRRSDMFYNVSGYIKLVGFRSKGMTFVVYLRAIVVSATQDLVIVKSLGLKHVINFIEFRL